MRFLILSLLSCLLVAAAADLSEFRRTEDWESQLTNATQLAREQRFEEANALFTTLTDRVVLLRNDATRANAWLTLDLVGSKGRDPFGAKVEIEALAVL